jgi:hypothetical protein
MQPLPGMSEPTGPGRLLPDTQIRDAQLGVASRPATAAAAFGALPEALSARRSSSMAEQIAVHRRIS